MLFTAAFSFQYWLLNFECDYVAFKILKCTSSHVYVMNESEVTCNYVINDFRTLFDYRHIGLLQ